MQYGRASATEAAAPTPLDSLAGRMEAIDHRRLRARHVPRSRATRLTVELIESAVMRERSVSVSDDAAMIVAHEPESESGRFVTVLGDHEPVTHSEGCIAGV